jgi:uncharacterized protein YegL
MQRLDAAVEFANNPDPRCPCVLLLDTSYSMTGAPIAALNEGLRAFQQDIRLDELAARRVEVAIVTFGHGGVDVLQDFVLASSLELPTLTAAGDTPMGAAINRALDLLAQRKAEYRSHGVAYYRPWAFLITDGEPTDGDAWRQAAQRIRTEEHDNGVAFFAVGVDRANMQRLATIAVREPVKLKGHNFREMFLWLSRSQKRVSAGTLDTQTALEPIGWGTV